MEMANETEQVKISYTQSKILARRSFSEGGVNQKSKII